jgi:hypothetical protein
MMLVRKCGVCTWFRDENFHVCPSRTIAQEGLNRRVVIRWEDDCIKAIWQRADENWLNEVRYAKKGRCTYQISDKVDVHTGCS